MGWKVLPIGRDKSERADRMAAMRASGMTLQVIAEAFGVSRQYVHAALKRRDAKR